jgi:hypothetical protein
MSVPALAWLNGISRMSGGQQLKDVAQGDQVQAVFTESLAISGGPRQEVAAGREARPTTAAQDFGGTSIQPGPGSKVVTAGGFGPRFFWNTLPFWLTMKVITPERPHSAG